MNCAGCGKKFESDEWMKFIKRPVCDECLTVVLRLRRMALESQIYEINKKILELKEKNKEVDK
jgi:NAD-dependent SIR2 family protein deacetylase